MEQSACELLRFKYVESAILDLTDADLSCGFRDPLYSSMLNVSKIRQFGLI